MSDFAWTVIGAGPAGIAAVGRLIDHGVPPEAIAWIDPEFAAGDMGQKWRAVWSNTHASSFLWFMNASPAFRYCAGPHFALSDVPPDETCPLRLVADALVWITQQLRTRVHTVSGMATDLTLHNGRWRIQTSHGELCSGNVILAVGATPKRLCHPQLTEIPVEVALDPQRLAEQSLAGATVAVFGSSHSTMIALPNLLASPVERVVNFYRSPLRYAVYLQDWILFDDIGLKGKAAQWARQNIDGLLPQRLERHWIQGDEFDDVLKTCDHVVYTVGFERRALPRTSQWGRLGYNSTNGIIAPGLFGLGVAYPEYRIDPLGFGQYRVGLQKFMEYLNCSLPLWLQYPA